MPSGTFYPTVIGDDVCWYQTTFYAPANDVNIGDGGGPYKASIRFPDITIPQGSTITSAIITFQGYGSTALDNCNVIIYGNDVDSAVAPTTYGEGDALALTTGYVNWGTIAHWTDSTAFDSPNISAILQEIVDRAGFASGNAVQFVIVNDASTNLAYRAFYAYDASGGSLKAALSVTWTEPVTPRTITTTINLPLPQMKGVTVNPNRQISGVATFPFQKMEGEITNPSRQILGRMTLPLSSLHGAISVASFTATIAGAIGAISAEGYGGGYADLAIPSIALSAGGTTGFIGSFDQLIPPITLTSLAYQEIVGTLIASIPAITISAHELPAFTGTLNVSIPMVRVSASALAGFTGSLNKSIHPVTLTGNSYWMGTNSLDTSIPAITLNALAKAAAADIIGLSLNTKNFGLTKYTDFAYNSLCIFNGNLVGAKDDGIYEVTDDHENEDPIIWRIRTGKLDLLKNYLRYVWITGTITGNIKMVVEDGEGNRYEYEGEPVSLNSHELRLKVGKGLKSRYVTIELYNESDEQVVIDKLRVFGKPGARKR